MLRNNAFLSTKENYIDYDRASGSVTTNNPGVLKRFLSVHAATEVTIIGATIAEMTILLHLLRLSHIKSLTLKDCALMGDVNFASHAGLSSLSIQSSILIVRAVQFQNKFDLIDGTQEAVAQAFLKSIGSISTLKSLELTNCCYGVVFDENGSVNTKPLLSGEALHYFAYQSLVSKQRLKVLNVSHSDIGAFGAQAIAQLSSLERLDISNNPIGDIGFRMLCADELLREAGDFAMCQFDIDDIPSPSKRERLAMLETLDAANIGLTDAGLTLLSKKHLRVLNLDGNSLTTSSCHVLCAQPVLNELSLNDNRIGDNGACILATGYFNALSLDGNGISAKGAIALFGRNKCQLVSLSLAQNPLGDHQEMGSVLSENRTLTVLDLTATQLHDRSIFLLFLEGSKTQLMSLILNNNMLTDDIFESVFQSKIKNIQIDGNRLLSTECLDWIHANNNTPVIDDVRFDAEAAVDALLSDAMLAGQTFFVEPPARETVVNVLPAEKDEQNKPTFS